MGDGWMWCSCSGNSNPARIDVEEPGGAFSALHRSGLMPMISGYSTS